MAKFTKIRKWADENGVTIREWMNGTHITITLPNGKQFEAQQKESTSSRVINRGRGMKWAGSPAGFYFTDVPEKGYGGYPFESTQAKAIEKMKEYL